MGAPCLADNSRNLVEWALSGKYDAERPILIDASNPLRFISRRKATELVTGLAAAFEKDTTVCLHISNDVLYPVLMLGILASRCRWTGTNISYTHHELAHHFRLFNTRYVITSAEHLQTVEAAVAGLGFEVEIILFSDILGEQESQLPHPLTGGKGLRTFHDLLDSASDEQSLQTHLRELSNDVIAVLQSTSGTTGLPKMAARTHHSMILESQAIEDNNAAKPYEVRRLFCTPIFHAFSTQEMAINPLRLGYPTYFMTRFDDTFAQRVYDFGITETAAPPPMILRLLQVTDQHHLLQSFRLIFSGGAPLAPELHHRMLGIFKVAPRIVQVWGMTEGGWFTTFKYPEVDTTGSVGRMLPGWEIRIDSDTLIALPDGRSAGELLVKSAQLMTGYLGNTEATEATFTDGWLRTGDIGFVEDGKVYIVDRAKDLIKVNGWQVAPAEIEEALLQSPDVVDAAAISFGHGNDEHPMVFVVARDAGVEVQDIEAHLHSRLARYKVARIEVKLVELIPRNPSGKILRKVLRSLATESGQVGH